jgi:hypothetical protein
VIITLDKEADEEAIVHELLHAKVHELTDGYAYALEGMARGVDDGAYVAREQLICDITSALGVKSR